MRDVTKIDVVSSVDLVAGVVGLRQPHARADIRANSGPANGGAHAGAHEGRANARQCASHKRASGEHFDRP